MDYMKTHSDSIDQSYASRLSEGIDDFDPADVYGNVKDNPTPNMDRKAAPEFDGFEPVKVGAKMNLKNAETGGYVSDDWFDWVGYMINGVAIVYKRGIGYNLMGENGNILLPEWHEDISETRDNTAYILIDGETRQKIKVSDLAL